MIRELNTTNLPLFPKEVLTPSYDRTKIKTGIVHIGIGGFHRSHQAFYTDRLLCQYPDTKWGICGVSLLETDRKIFDILVRQDGLYTLMVAEPDGTLSARIIGSIVEYLFAPDMPDAVIEKMADPETKVITLTITEGGYNLNADTGEFQFEEPSIQRDLNHPDQPKTVFGFLTQALKRRKERGMPGLTIQSCDNIQKNGDVLKKMLLSFVRAAEPDLIDWIDKQVSFPNSMVDRITPVTLAADIEKLRSNFGIEDTWPVVCEPFIQWIIEDHYANGRPAWENVGAQFVPNVDPYEKMKIRLLNAGHSLLGITGSLCGYQTISETVNDPVLRTYLRKFMDDEVTPVLGNIEGVNLDDYKDSLIQRFGNPNIKDLLTRICSQSSAKIPKFLLPTLKEQLQKGGPIKLGTTIVAAWCRYLELVGTPGHYYGVQDEMFDVLKEKADVSVSAEPLAFLKVQTIFGDLIHSKRFVDTYLETIDQIRRHGIVQVIRQSNL